MHAHFRRYAFALLLCLICSPAYAQTSAGAGVGVGAGIGAGVGIGAPATTPTVLGTPGTTTGTTAPTMPTDASQASQISLPETSATGPTITGASNTPAAQAPLQTFTPPTASAPPANKFQEFVSTATGHSLPMFGYSLFHDTPSTFAPVDNIPLTSNYVIGPGDQILIRAWGQVNIDYSAVVDRNGSINVPQVGIINVAGVRYQDLHNFIKSSFNRVFRNYELNVTLGQLRSIQVFVVGQAERPGAYTVSSLSSLVNTLFVSGGPSATGSMRHILLKRGDTTVADFDLYDLLLKGDTSKDVPLLPGDVIYIPPIGSLAAIDGSINTPGIYELKDNETLNDLLTMAGGLTTTAAGQKATVERIVGHETRMVDEFTLDSKGLAHPMHDGDIVTTFTISPRIENAVSIRGYVAQPMHLPWKQGIKISDVLPEINALIAPDYWINRNKAIQKDVSSTSALQNDVVVNLPDVNWEYAVIERINPVDLTSSLIPFNLGKIVRDKNPQYDLPLQPGDIITIFSKDDIQVPVSQRTRFARVEGEVAHPGIYQLEPNETLRHLVKRIGGLTPDAYLYAAEFTRESTRIAQQKHLDDALNQMEAEIQREGLENQSQQATADEAAIAKNVTISQLGLLARLRTAQATGRIVLEIPKNGSGADDLPDIVLENNDRLYVPSQVSTVAVVGTVYNPNTFLYQSGKDVKDYLNQAGPTATADTGSLYIVRADGSVLSKRQASWFSSFNSKKLMPGDTIVVPEKLDTFNLTRELKDWAQIVYQFALGVVAIHVLSN